jgi:hypothetical protein
MVLLYFLFNPKFYSTTMYHLLFYGSVLSISKSRRAGISLAAQIGFVGSVAGKLIDSAGGVIQGNNHQIIANPQE